MTTAPLQKCVIAPDGKKISWTIQLTETCKVVKKNTCSTKNARNAIDHHSRNTFHFPTSDFSSNNSVTAGLSFPLPENVSNTAFENNSNLDISSSKPRNLDEKIDNGNHSRLCCSPESGFGSEHQYSPLDVPGSEVNGKFDRHSDENTTEKDELLNAERNAEFKIVSVQSLANTKASTETPSISSPACSAQKENYSDQCECIAYAKRLYIRQDGRKSSLYFDHKLVSDCKENLKEFSSNTRCVRKRLKRLPFSGLPALTYRKTFTLDKKAIKCLVYNLFALDSTDRPSCESTSATPEKLSKLVSVSPSKPTRVSSRRLKSQLDIKDGNLEIPVAVQDDDGSRRAKVAKDDTKTREQSTVLPPIEHMEVNSCQPKKQDETSYKAASHEVSSKIDRIRRLKEIVRQREKDLEKVRKSCGFIK